MSIPSGGIGALRDALAAGETSARALVETALERASASQDRAFVHLRGEAIGALAIAAFSI